MLVIEECEYCKTNEKGYFSSSIINTLHMSIQMENYDDVPYLIVGYTGDNEGDMERVEIKHCPMCGRKLCRKIKTGYEKD